MASGNDVPARLGVVVCVVEHDALDSRANCVVVRNALCVLGRLLEGAAVEATPGGGLRTLRVGADGTWFQVDDGVRIDLSRQLTLARLLCRLSEQPLGPEGRTVTMEELIEAGWPGEAAMRKPWPTACGSPFRSSASWASKESS